MHVSVSVVAAVLCCLLAGCSSRGPSVASSQLQESTRSTPSQPISEPILQLWQDAIYSLKTDASPLFVLWEDGTVLQRLPNQRLYRGKLEKQQVDELMSKLQIGGFFDGPHQESHVRPDGGSRTLVARMNGFRVRLSYDGMYDGPGELDRIDPSASPSREQTEFFVRRWHSAQRVIDDIAPKQMTLVTGELALPYPATQPTR